MAKFLWGSATASYQCEGAWDEGGKGPSVWDNYFHNINSAAISGDRASDVYHRYEEDLEMMKQSNQNTYRFSISWPRIFPKNDGKVNKEGVEFYHRLLDTMIRKGITPNVTLYHWDLPLYLQEYGGWLNRKTSNEFAKYADFCFKEFGSKIKIWATLNEPYYSVQCMYGSGNYPPNSPDGQMFAEAIYNQMLGSALAVKRFRNHKNIGQIGIVADIHPCYGIDESKECKKAVFLADQFYNGVILEPAMKGEFPKEIIEELAKQYDFSFMKEDDSSIFRDGIVDFLGLNYYNRSYIRPYMGGPSMVTHNNAGKRDDKRDGGDVKRIMVVKDLFERVEDPNGEFTEWDFEIFPRGLYDACMEVKEKYGDVPIYIAENGIGVHERLENNTVEDDGRIDFLKRHMYYLLKAIEDGANIRGYYVWSTMDIYSWINGYEKRYGLVYVDFETQKRYAKKSYYWYKDFIANHQIEIREQTYGQ